MEDIIRIEALDKHYGKTHAVNNLSFRVKTGELFAFLGVNGAGKSTTIGMMCGQIPKDAGKIIISGHEIAGEAREIKKDIGVVFQDSHLDESLTVYENLLYRAGLYGITKDNFTKRYKEVSRLFELDEIKNQKLKTLSGGQRRRVDIARAIIHNPKILILDEPTTGLDPGTRKKIWKSIETLRKKNNMTIFLTTHYMEEAVDADYIVILDKGKIKAEGTPHDLKNTYASDTLYLYNIDEEDVKTLDLPYTKVRDGFKVELDNLEVALDLIMLHRDLFKDFEIIKGKMDDVFLNATGYELED